jgi:NitT/TauT family transport system permease protein
VVACWQLVAWSHWKPESLLPGPGRVLARLYQNARDPGFFVAVAVTLRRAFIGYGLALVLGSLIGLAVARTRIVRAAIGSVITGLQTMPSIVWFPLAILLFQLTEQAILLVVVLGAAPAIANGLISGIDHIPPLLLRSGRVIGARGPRLYRYVILPAALPAFLGGLKQGWAFAWRSLMSAELLVVAANQTSIGQQLQSAGKLFDMQQLLAIMVVIFVIGIVVDSLFGMLDTAVRRRWGLLGSEA